MLPFLNIGVRNENFHWIGKQPLFKEELKIYVIGGDKISLHAYRNIGERPSQPIMALLFKQFNSWNTSSSFMWKLIIVSKKVITGVELLGLGILCFL